MEKSLILKLFSVCEDCNNLWFKSTEREGYGFHKQTGNTGIDLEDAISAKIIDFQLKDITRGWAQVRTHILYISVLYKKELVLYRFTDRCKYGKTLETLMNVKGAIDYTETLSLNENWGKKKLVVKNWKCL